MLDRVYYIILCGASHCSFLNSQAVEGLKMWNGLNSASSTLFISAIQAKILGDEQVSPAVINNKESRPFGA